MVTIKRRKKKYSSDDMKCVPVLITMPKFMKKIFMDYAKNNGSNLSKFLRDSAKKELPARYKNRLKNKRIKRK